MSALVEVEIVEDLTEEGGVSSSKLEDASLDFSKEVSDGLLRSSGVFFLGNLPRGLHHSYKVFVGGSAHGKVGIIVKPFLS